MTYGASILTVSVPDRFGLVKNIALCLNKNSGYIPSGIYAGAIMGPNAGRIRDGKIQINGNSFQLAQNEGRNNLHGGPHNVSKMLWEEIKIEQNPDNLALSLKCFLPDKLDGFPGNRDIIVRYVLDDSDTIKIEFSAVSDQATWINLSNHTYFNLTGDFWRTALDHRLKINSENVLYNDDRNLPIGMRCVSDTPFDFSEERRISDNIARFPADPQLLNALGYNHAFDIRSSTGEAVCLADPLSGRRMRLYTDLPSVVFYSGGFLNDSILLKDEIPAHSGCALTFEAQQFPDAVNQPDLPKEFLIPGEFWKHFIAYRFDTL